MDILGEGLETSKYKLVTETSAVLRFRLAKAFEDLDNFLKAEVDLKDIKEYGTALTVLEEARPQLP